MVSIFSSQEDKNTPPPKKKTKACSLFFGVKCENENGVIGLQPSWMSMFFFLPVGVVPMVVMAVL